MVAIVAIAGASHMATLGVLAGLSVLDVIAWLLRRRLRIAPKGLAVAVTATCSGLALLLVTDVLVAGRFVLTPGGSVFFLGRLLEDGMLSKILAEECPRPDWQFCNFRNELPTYAEAFLNLANVWTSAGRPDQGEICCGEALRLQPQLAEAWINLGVALAALMRVPPPRIDFVTRPRLAKESANG